MIKPVPKPHIKLNYSLILLILNILLTSIYWWQLPPEIPLFYSSPYGSNQLSHKIWFLLLPGFSIFSFVYIHMIAKLKVKSVLYLSMLNWLTTLCLFLFSLAMIHIILVTL